MRRVILAGLALASLVGAGSAVAQERWGHWDPTWGPDPGPPPGAVAHHWRHRENQWYAHVHQCMGRSHYDAHRDMYRVGHRWVSCRD